VAYIHEYERSLVVRVKYRVDNDGGITNWICVDSDLPDRDTLLGVLLRTQRVVLEGNDNQVEEIKPAALVEAVGEWTVDDEDTP
jgi:hypothetical protein